MPLQPLYWNRRLVYVCLLIFGSLTLIDALPRYTLLHGDLKETIDPALDVTGLWQGSWELFAPVPDHVNVSVQAELHWRDGSQTLWRQPEWHSMSAWEKMRRFREMSFYDGLWRSDNRPAWEPFCRYLAQQAASQSDQELERVVLFQMRDVIQPPQVDWRPAYAPPQYTQRYSLYTWVVDEE